MDTMLLQDRTPFQRKYRVANVGGTVAATRRRMFTSSSIAVCAGSVILIDDRRDCAHHRAPLLLVPRKGNELPLHSNTNSAASMRWQHAEDELKGRPARQVWQRLMQY